MISTAFIAALEREVKPVTRQWRPREQEHESRQYRFFESDRAVLICAGIGAEAARRATEAAIHLYSPDKVWSVGFAGALHSDLKVGSGFQPRRIVDATDGSISETDRGEGTLVSYNAIADIDQKHKLGRAYGALAVDMEAAAVSRGARARGVAFAAYKVISDERDFELAGMERFIRDGEFRTGAFVASTLVRPWLWPKVILLGRNSSRAAEALSRWLLQYTTGAESLENKPAELHPIN